MNESKVDKYFREEADWWVRKMARRFGTDYLAWPEDARRELTKKRKASKDSAKQQPLWTVGDVPF